MYESFYNFKEKPFDLHPDPDYLYMSRIHEDTYAHMEYAISENKGFVIITGEIGSGKTTLINYLLGNIDEEIQIGLINNTNILPDQFLKLICQEFELETASSDKAELLDKFSSFLIDQFSLSNRVVLIIDEAQNLNTDTIEEIRMLSNIETEKQHLVQIILVGQPELKFKLKKGLLKQLSQRVSVHCHLKGLERYEVEQYIKHRLTVGGASRFNIFEKRAIGEIAKYSRGIPRLINVLCDSSLVYGFADGLNIIDTDVVKNVYLELRSLGTFAEYDRTSQKTFVHKTEEATGSSIYDKRLTFLENKTDILHQALNDLRDKVGLIDKKRSERDEIVIELFYMLKDNLKHREKMLKTFYGKNHNNKSSTKGRMKDPSGLGNVSSIRKDSIKRNVQ